MSTLLLVAQGYWQFKGIFQLEELISTRIRVTQVIFQLNQRLTLKHIVVGSKQRHSHTQNHFFIHPTELSEHLHLNLLNQKLDWPRFCFFNWCKTDLGRNLVFMICWLMFSFSVYGKGLFFWFFVGPHCKKNVVVFAGNCYQFEVKKVIIRKVGWKLSVCGIEKVEKRLGT